MSRQQQIKKTDGGHRIFSKSMRDLQTRTDTAKTRQKHVHRHPPTDNVQIPIEVAKSSANKSETYINSASINRLSQGPASPLDRNGNEVQNRIVGSCFENQRSVDHCQSTDSRFSRKSSQLVSETKARRSSKGRRNNKPKPYGKKHIEHNQLPVSHSAITLNQHEFFEKSMTGNHANANKNKIELIKDTTSTTKVEGTLKDVCGLVSKECTHCFAHGTADLNVEDWSTEFIDVDRKKEDVEMSGRGSKTSESNGDCVIEQNGKCENKTNEDKSREIKTAGIYSDTLDNNLVDTNYISRNESLNSFQWNDDKSHNDEIAVFKNEIKLKIAIVDLEEVAYQTPASTETTSGKVAKHMNCNCNTYSKLDIKEGYKEKNQEENIESLPEKKSKCKPTKPMSSNQNRQMHDDGSVVRNRDNRNHLNPSRTRHDFNVNRKYEDHRQAKTAVPGKDRDVPPRFRRQCPNERIHCPRANEKPSRARSQPKVVIHSFRGFNPLNSEYVQRKGAGRNAARHRQVFRGDENLLQKSNNLKKSRVSNSSWDLPESEDWMTEIEDNGSEKNACLSDYSNIAEMEPNLYDKSRENIDSIWNNGVCDKSMDILNIANAEVANDFEKQHDAFVYIKKTELNEITETDRVVDSINVCQDFELNPHGVRLPYLPPPPPPDEMDTKSPTMTGAMDERWEDAGEDRNERPMKDINDFALGDKLQEWRDFLKQNGHNLDEKLASAQTNKNVDIKGTVNILSQHKDIMVNTGKDVKPRVQEISEHHAGSLGSEDAKMHSDNSWKSRMLLTKVCALDEDMENDENFSANSIASQSENEKMCQVELGSKDDGLDIPLKKNNVSRKLRHFKSESQECRAGKNLNAKTFDGGWSESQRQWVFDDLIKSGQSVPSESDSCHLESLESEYRFNKLDSIARQYSGYDEYENWQQMYQQDHGVGMYENFHQEMWLKQAWDYYCWQMFHYMDPYIAGLNTNLNAREHFEPCFKDIENDPLTNESDMASSDLEYNMFAQHKSFRPNAEPTCRTSPMMYDSNKEETEEIDEKHKTGVSKKVETRIHETSLSSLREKSSRVYSSMFGRIDSMTYDGNECTDVNIQQVDKEKFYPEQATENEDSEVMARQMKNSCKTMKNNTKFDVGTSEKWTGNCEMLGESSKSMKLLPDIEEGETTAESQCGCMANGIQYMVWRSCQCAAGKPPKLQCILPNFPCDASVDLGYQSYESLDVDDRDVSLKFAALSPFCSTPAIQQNELPIHGQKDNPVHKPAPPGFQGLLGQRQEFRSKDSSIAYKEENHISEIKRDSNSPHQTLSNHGETNVSSVSDLVYSAKHLEKAISGLTQAGRQEAQLDIALDSVRKRLAELHKTLNIETMEGDNADNCGCATDDLFGTDERQGPVKDNMSSVKNWNNTCGKTTYELAQNDSLLGMNVKEREDFNINTTVFASQTNTQPVHNLSSNFKNELQGLNETYDSSVSGPRSDSVGYSLDSGDESLGNYKMHSQSPVKTESKNIIGVVKGEDDLEGELESSDDEIPRIKFLKQHSDKSRPAVRPISPHSMKGSRCRFDMFPRAVSSYRPGFSGFLLPPPMILGPPFIRGAVKENDPRITSPRGKASSFREQPFSWEGLLDTSPREKPPEGISDTLSCQKQESPSSRPLPYGPFIRPAYPPSLLSPADIQQWRQRMQSQTSSNLCKTHDLEMNDQVVSKTEEKAKPISTELKHREVGKLVAYDTSSDSSDIEPFDISELEKPVTSYNKHTDSLKMKSAGDVNGATLKCMPKKLKVDISNIPLPPGPQSCDIKKNPSPDNLTGHAVSRLVSHGPCKLKQKTLKSFSSRPCDSVSSAGPTPIVESTSTKKEVVADKPKKKTLAEIVSCVYRNSCYPEDMEASSKSFSDATSTGLSKKSSLMLTPGCSDTAMLPPFPGSTFWNMYMPGTTSALTGRCPESESAGKVTKQATPTRFSMSPSHNCSPGLSTSVKSNNTTLAIQKNWKINFKQFHSFGVKYIDTHCHLDFLFKRDGFNGSLAAYIAKHPEVFPEEFEGCVAVFCNPASFTPDGGLWKEVAKEDNVWIAMGCHPKMATEYDSIAEVGLHQCLQHSKCVALGEIGLDYSGTFHQHEATQKRVFRSQLEIAIAMRKPLVIHCREAEEDCLEIMKEIVPRNYKIHCHCFTLWFSNAKRWLDSFPNLFIGVTPLVTYTSAKPTHDLARNIPIERLLLETDSPYFIPRCIPKDELRLSSPGLAITVAKEIARYQELPVSTVLHQCRLNTKFLYGI